MYMFDFLFFLSSDNVKELIMFTISKISSTVEETKKKKKITIIIIIHNYTYQS